MPNRRLLAFLALIAASSIWGANNAVMKITLLTVPVFSLAFIRFGVASLILLPFVAKKLAIKRPNYPMLILSGLCGVTFNIAFFFWGIKLTTALNAGIIVSSLPIFTLLFAKLFLKEKLSPNLLLGALLGFLGIGAIVGKDILTHGILLSPIGDFLILLATLTFVGYEILSKKLFKMYDAFSVTFYSFAIGALTFIPLTLFEFLQNPLWVTNLRTSSILGIFYGIFLSSLSAYSLWQWGLSKIPASRVGFFFYLDPIVSTIAAVMLLSEQITLPFLIGAACIFLGIFIAEGRLPYHHIQKSNEK